MDSVLDFLFLRRLKMEYISPPICPFPISSASGLSIPTQTICPLTCPNPPINLGEFLVWDIEPLPGVCCTDVVCFNLYQQVGGSFVTVNECQPVNSIVVCSAGTWEISAILTTGVENPPVGPFVSDGITPLTINLPFVQGLSQYRIVKDGHTVLLSNFSSGIEVCSDACYAVSQITSDGETCLSGLTCVKISPPIPPDSLNDVIAYWKLNDAQFGTRVDSVGTNNLTDVGAYIGTGSGLVYPVGVKAIDHGPGLVSLQHPDDAILGAGPGVSFTFDFWVNNTFNLSPGRPILSKANAFAPPTDYLCDVQGDGNIGWRLTDTNGNAYQLNSGVSIGTAGVDNKWHHVTCGYDASIKQAFIQVDLAPMVTQATLFDIARTSVSFTIFGFSNNAFSGFGSMSGVGLWKRRLTNVEIARLYNGGAGYPLENFYP